jgi:hypothetical protein
MVEGAARGITRRRLMRRAGSVALGAAVVTAYGSRTREEAIACTSPSPCYGAPLCGSHRCNGFYCAAGRSDTNWSCYGGGRCCGNSGVDNCWEYTPTRTRCCDCCAYRPSCTTGASCSGCGSSGWYTCICKGGY